MKGFKYEVSNTRRALLEGLGVSEESKTVNGAVKPEELGREDANLLDEAEGKKFRSLAATLN